MTGLTITEFLLARIEDDEEAASRVLVSEVDQSTGVPQIQYRAIRDRVLAECEAKRRIVELHESWPVLVETPLEIENDVVRASSANELALRMSQRIDLLTQRQYRDKFGDEPPTAPMIAALAAVYADHPDFQDEWRP